MGEYLPFIGVFCAVVGIINVIYLRRRPWRERLFAVACVASVCVGVLAILVVSKASFGLLWEPTARGACEERGLRFEGVDDAGRSGRRRILIPDSAVCSAGAEPVSVDGDVVDAHELARFDITWLGLELLDLAAAVLWFLIFVVAAGVAGAAGFGVMVVRLFGLRAPRMS